MTDWQPNGAYYGSKHFFRFVKPDAVRVDCSADGGLKTMAFKNKDGSVAIVVVSGGSTSVSLAIKTPDPAWVQASYDDSQWGPVGRLNLGSQYYACPNRFYFRKTFDAGTVGAAKLTMTARKHSVGHPVRTEFFTLQGKKISAARAQASRRADRVLLQRSVHSNGSVVKRTVDVRQ